MGERGGCTFPNIGMTGDEGGWVLGFKQVGWSRLGDKDEKGGLQTRVDKGAWEQG